MCLKGMPFGGVRVSCAGWNSFRPMPMPMPMPMPYRLGMPNVSYGFWVGIRTIFWTLQAARPNDSRYSSGLFPDHGFLSSSFVVAADVFVESFVELLERHIFLGPVVEELVLEPSEEPLAGRVVR